MWTSVTALLCLVVLASSARQLVVPGSALAPLFSSDQFYNDDIESRSDVSRPTTTAPQRLLRSMCLSPRGMFRHPTDCHKYLDCWDGRVLEKFCPEGLVFSDLPGGFCDHPEYVECDGRFTTTPKPSPTPSPDPDPVTDIAVKPVVGPTPAVANIVKLSTGYYVFESEKVLNWVEARKYCTSLGPSMDLLSMESREELLQISAYISGTGQTQHTNLFYIGATDEGKEGKFYWAPTGRDVTFNAWDANEPNNGDEYGPENCVTFWVNSPNDLRWNDIPCALPRGFACEFYPPSVRAEAIPTLIKNDAAFQRLDNSTAHSYTRREILYEPKQPLKTSRRRGARTQWQQ